jgi:hypothetical protein
MDIQDMNRKFENPNSVCGRDFQLRFPEANLNVYRAQMLNPPSRHFFLTSPAMIQTTGMPTSISFEPSPTPIYNYGQTQVFP